MTRTQRQKLYRIYVNRINMKFWIDNLMILSQQGFTIKNAVFTEIICNHIFLSFIFISVSIIRAMNFVAID